MKSSTIRRSNLSKEKMAVLEALSKFNDSNENSNNGINDASGINSEPMEDGSPEVYVRPSKEKELDILWKDFKLPKGEHSPIVYLGIGFVSGVIATILVTTFIGMSSGNFHLKKAPTITDTTTVEAGVAINDEANNASEDAVTEDTSKGKKFGLFGSNKNAETAEPAAPQTREYEVQSGDTMEKIVRNLYGTYSPLKVEAIMNINDLSDVNKLSIGQKLLVPVEGLVESSSEQ